MDKKEIQNILDSIIINIGRANILVITMLVKRVLWRSNINEAINQLEMAKKKLGELYDRTNKS